MSINCRLCTTTHTEISDNNYELEEDEDNDLLSRQTVTPWNISYKIVFEMTLVGVRSAILNKAIFLAAWTCKTNVLWQPFSKYLLRCINTICSIFDSNKVMTYSFWSPTNTIIVDIKSVRSTSDFVSEAQWSLTNWYTFQVTRRRSINWPCYCSVH
jgi:hypothetical protein